MRDDQDIQEYRRSRAAWARALEERDALGSYALPLNDPNHPSQWDDPDRIQQLNLAEQKLAEASAIFLGVSRRLYPDED